MVTEKWIDNHRVNIHFLDNENTNHDLTPLLIIPGVTESAEDYLTLIQAFPERRCVAVTLRGRGKSDSPSSGYTLEDHISDIESVINDLQINRFCILAYSRGVAYALGTVIKKPELLKGMIIGDYPPYHTKLPDGWGEWIFQSGPWRGRDVANRITLHALTRIEKESEAYDFTSQLCLIQCPVLIIRGGKEGALLTKEEAEKYQKALQDVDLVVLESCDHNIWDSLHEEVLGVIRRFLVKIDKK